MIEGRVVMGKKKEYRVILTVKTGLTGVELTEVFTDIADEYQRIMKVKEILTADDSCEVIQRQSKKFMEGIKW
jgi:hypothetical protein